MVNLEISLNTHLCSLAQFYAFNNKYMMAEGLFRQALGSLENQPSIPGNAFRHPLGLQAYAAALSMVEKREREAQAMAEKATAMIEAAGQEQVDYLATLNRLHVPKFIL
mmetsp:Transcript_13437/g.22872  ORF Transcript_13437/g.22872 Transcript_13437/m.22872 type:complete len:109 (-) Transcript_13437:35-361(-)